MIHRHIERIVMDILRRYRVVITCERCCRAISWPDGVCTSPVCRRS